VRKAPAYSRALGFVKKAIAELLMASPTSVPDHLVCCACFVFLSGEILTFMAFDLIIT